MLLHDDNALDGASVPRRKRRMSKHRDCSAHPSERGTGHARRKKVRPWPEMKAWRKLLDGDVHDLLWHDDNLFDRLALKQRFDLLCRQRGGLNLLLRGVGGNFDHVA